jgi:uncharacterized protein YjbI with pentapeptide repeats
VNREGATAYTGIEDSASRGDGHGKPLIDQQREDEDFSAADLSDVEMENCSFLRCSFYGALFSSAMTNGCSFEACDFTDARLNGSEHHHSAFTNCSFKAPACSPHFWRGASSLAPVSSRPS